jgi:hypothetical protein
VSLWWSFGCLANFLLSTRTRAALECGKQSNFKLVGRFISGPEISLTAARRGLNRNTSAFPEDLPSAAIPRLSKNITEREPSAPYFYAEDLLKH